MERLRDAAELSYVDRLQQLESVGKVDLLSLQRERVRIVTDSVLRGSPLKRSERLKDGGAMMTTVGASQTFGNFTENRGVVPPKANKPEETALVEELRTNVKLYLPSE